jgi:hypothetical protein
MIPLAAGRTALEELAMASHKWLHLKHLTMVREKEGWVQGPAFCYGSGQIARVHQYEEEFIERLSLV